MIKTIPETIHHTISIEGVVTNVKTGKTKAIWIGANGYKHFDYSENGVNKKMALHRALALAFIPNPENKRTVNHIDGNKLNNCLANLEWATDSENIAHSCTIDGRGSCAKFTPEVYEDYVEKVLQGCTLTELSKDIDLSLAQLSIHTKAAAERLGKLEDYLTALALNDRQRKSDWVRKKHKVSMSDPLTKEVIRVFDSIMDATKALGKKSSGPISNMLNSKQNTAYGYIWERV